MSNVPDELVYTAEHEYVARTGDAAVVRVGITDYAQGELGDVVFVNLPKPGQRLEAHESFGTIEAVKAVSELYSPLAGEVVEVNGALDGDPAVVNRDPYGDGWMVTLRRGGSEGARRAAGGRGVPGAHRGVTFAGGERGVSRNNLRDNRSRLDDAPGAWSRGFFVAHRYLRLHPAGASVPHDHHLPLRPRGPRSRRPPSRPFRLPAHRAAAGGPGGDAPGRGLRDPRRVHRCRRARGDPAPPAARTPARPERARGAAGAPRAGRDEPGVPLLHRPGLRGHVHAAGRAAERAGEPRLVHRLHAVPGGDLAGPPGGAAQLPDHGVRPHRARDRQRLAARRGHRRGRGDAPDAGGEHDQGAAGIPGRRVLPPADDRGGADACRSARRTRRGGRAGDLHLRSRA